jgi:hypothetical protein
MREAIYTLDRTHTSIAIKPRSPSRLTDGQRPDNVLLVTRITTVTNMQSTLFASHTIDTGEVAPVPITDPDPPPIKW